MFTAAWRLGARTSIFSHPWGEPGSLPPYGAGSGWTAGAPALGFPGLVLDPAGSEVQGLVFSSEKLVEFWPQLDEFEGAQYVRVPVEAVLAEGGVVEAYVYVLSPA